MIKRILLTRWPLVLWTVMIFIALTVNTGSMESVPMFGIRHLDKFVHCLLFGVMTFLWVYPTKDSSIGKLIFIFAIVACYGAGMEWIQENYTSREFDWKDIYADWVGAAAGIIAGKKIGPYGNRGRNQN